MLRNLRYVCTAHENLSYKIILLIDQEIKEDQLIRVTGAAQKFPELAPPPDIDERVSMPQPEFLFLDK